MNEITSFESNLKVLPMLLDNCVTYVPDCSLSIEAQTCDARVQAAYGLKVRALGIGDIKDQLRT